MENTSNLTGREHRCHKYTSMKYPPGGVKETLILANVICAVATIFLNSMICAAVYKVKRLRTPSNVVLFSLSVADLVMAANFVFQIVFLSSDDDNKYEPCLIMGHCHYIIVSIVILHLAAISIDRLVAIQWHMRYQTFVTCKRMLACVIVLWILGTFLQFLLKLLIKGDHHREMAVFYKFNLGCSHPNATYHHKWMQGNKWEKWEKKEALHKAQMYMVVLLIVNLALPFTIIAASYAAILNTSMKHFKRIKAQEATNIARKTTEIRAANTIAIIVASFLVCFTPMFAISVVQVYTRPCWGKHFGLKVLATVQSLSAVLNPLIYAGRNQEFRAAFRKILGLKSKEKSNAFPNRLQKQPRRDSGSIAESAEVQQNKPEHQVDSVKQE